MHTFVRTMTAVAALTVLSSIAAAQDQQASIEDMLVGRSASEAVEMLSARVEAEPDDDQARFALGIAQFLRSQESLFQELYDHGFLSRAQMLMMVAPGPAMLVPQNPQPKPINYDTVRSIIDRWLENVATAEATLAKVTANDVKLPVHIGLIRMDLNNDGEASEEESLWRLYAATQRWRELTQEQGQSFVIAFDRGDVNWLRGYCHLLMALGNGMQAYDTSELFNRTGQLFFAKPETPYAYLQEMPEAGDPEQMMIGSVLDLIAMIHLINFPLAEPDRMQRSLDHLQKVFTNAREMWTHYNAETDNENEWVPNPNQATVIPDITVTEEMQQTWLAFLDEAEQVLQGKKLIKFWREAGGRGVNLHRFFTEPRPFDLVLWVQGTAADPYLEEGPTFDPDTFDRMDQVFGNRFFNYAAWFN